MIGQVKSHDYGLEQYYFLRGNVFLILVSEATQGIPSQVHPWEHLETAEKMCFQNLCCVLDMCLNHIQNPSLLDSKTFSFCSFSFGAKAASVSNWLC